MDYMAQTMGENTRGPPGNSVPLHILRRGKTEDNLSKKLYVNDWK